MSQTFKDYVRAFSTADVRSTLRYYHEPLTLITAEKVVAMTRSQTEAFLTKLFETLKAQGYSGSEIVELHVKPLSATLAVASAAFVRYKTDRQELGRGGATYLLHKTSEGWKIAVLAAHPPDTVLRLEIGRASCRERV